MSAVNAQDSFLGGTGSPAFLHLSLHGLLYFALLLLHANIRQVQLLQGMELK